MNRENGNLHPDVAAFAKKRRKRKAWKKVVTAMSAAVVFVTTYALIIPAITMNSDTSCGKEEHVHSESCYVGIASGVEGGELICTADNENVHVHGDECYGPAEGGHIHDENCYEYALGELLCLLPEGEGHSHVEKCWIPGTEPVCGIPEGHIHDKYCFSEDVLVCPTPENHVHVSECCGYVLDCGLEECEAHAHSDECYEKIATLICTLEESEGEKVLLCEEVVSEHIHGDECYEARELICEMEEHTHDLACYANHEADRETAEQWEASFRGAELSGNWARDVLAIAETQLGYRESQINYIVTDDGDVRGYTRYGDWYGEGYDYGDWCAMFASFCLHYSGVGEAYPTNAYCPFWVNELTELGYYKIPYEYVPKSGDLIFFDWEQDGIVDHVGFVEAVEGTMVYTIEGNSNASVERREYELFDKRIDGYGELVQSNAPIGETDKDNTNAWVELIEEADEAIYGLSEEVLPQEAGVEQGAPMMRSGGATYGLSRGLFGARALGAPLDLTPYINAVTMYDANGNLLPSGSMVTEGDLIEFKLEYTITGQQLAVMNGEDLSVKTDTLTYSLPEIFEMVRSDSGNIVNSSGQTVGTYVIDSETETITMTFAEDYLRQNAKGIQIHGFISFFSTVTKITEEEGEHQDFKFTDKIILGVNIEEKHEAVGDLTIRKSKMSVDGEYITYELVVTSAEGTSGPITITDKMSAGLSFVEGISVRRGNGSSVNASFNAAADKSSFTMTLPEMAAGGSYTIRYRCKADIDLLGADLTVRNTASVSGKDSDGKDLKDETFVNHTFTALKKTGVANDDGTITWTITINQDKLDISGWTLEDILTTDKGASSYRGPVTIKNSAGNVVAQNVTLPYTFPAGSKDTYVISYTTAHDYADGVYISNKAILKDDDTEITVVSGTNIGQPTAKTGEAGEVTQVDGQYILPITWTVTVDTSIGEIPAGEVLIDTMEDWNSNEMYMTYSQLMAAYDNIKAALEAAGSSVANFTAKEYAYEMGQASDRKYSIDELDQNKLYEYFEVTLGKAIPKGKLITFTYETTGIFENNVLAGSIYTNQFSISGNYLVKANVQFTAGTIKAKKMALSYYDPNSPNNADWFWNLYHYNGTDGVTELEYEKLKEDYLAWTIELSAPLEFLGKGDIILYEDLPDDVTLKGLTLPFNSNIPTTTLKQWDIEHGETYEWTFDLYTAEQLLSWDRRNPQSVTITINVTESGDVEMIIPGVIFETMAQYATLYNELYGTTLDEWYGYLHIFTQIDEDFEWTEETERDKVYVHNFENRFTIEDEDGNVLDYGSQTQKITKDESSGVIRKKASTDENNIITYSVILNAYGRDLIENSDTLAIHDELSYPSADAKPLRVRLVPGSVKLYEIDLKSDGSYTKLSEIPINYRYNESSTEAGGVTNWLHTLDLTIPDGKSLVMEYSYKASGVKGSDHDVLNECTITGVGEGNLEGNVKVEIEVKEAAAQANIKGVMLYKVDANSDGIFLENAKFNIYIWNEEQGKYIIVHHPENGDTEFTTDVTGAIILDNSTIDEAQFAYNTAYYIVEVESPNGYYLSPEPYYFYIVHENTEAYPGCFPEGFTGHALTSGDIIYRQNVSEFTEIKVEKFWLDFVGNPMTVTGEKVKSVTLELWQEIQGQPESAKRFGTYTMTPDAAGNWSLTIGDLPKATKNADGTRGTNYLYYIKEVKVGGFMLESATNNEGTNSGTIRLTNKEMEGYLLPETGGIGTNVYTIGGLALCAGAAILLLYNFRPRRKEDFTSS